jgi:hypothetical protein
MDEHGHSRYNRFVGTMPIKDAVRKENEEIANKKIRLILKWFWEMC